VRDFADQSCLLKAGDHVLIPESVYTPNRNFAVEVLRTFGVEVGFYAPEAGAEIQTLFRENTRMVWCESPGSITFEVQDVPSIAAVAHRAGVMIVLDNTWSAGVYFDAFAHGVHVTMQALTKYAGGHSDLLLGSITTREETAWRQLGNTQQVLGCAASPDDCSLALRGLKTLAVRLKAIEDAALTLARWLSVRPEIERVLHPALPSCPGHAFWKRDFTGSTGVFSIVFQPRFSKTQVHGFVDRLELFEIGYSWAGVASLAVAYDFDATRGRPDYAHRIVRLNIGLEDVSDLQRISSGLSMGWIEIARHPLFPPASKLLSIYDEA
jgi:cystathionine beta-lyase